MKAQLRWVQRGILADPISGTAVLEYGPTEILPPVGAISKHPARLCRPGRQASRAHPRGKPGFSTLESGCGRETDCLLEEAGFEPSVPIAEGDASQVCSGLAGGLVAFGPDGWKTFVVVRTAPLSPADFSLNPTDWQKISVSSVKRLIV